MGSRRQKTNVKGVFSIEDADGARSYVARWKEHVPLDITDPLTTRRRTVEKRASTFEEACRLKAEGEAAERKRRPSPGFFDRLGDRMMAAKWFEYWARR